MKIKLLIIFILIFYSKAFSQKKTSENFIFNGKSTPVSRIDYSDHGILHFFINVYEDDYPNMFEENAIKCLNNEYNIYHTLYFFVKLPKGLTKDDKELFLLELVKNIDAKEKIKDVNYFVNLDSNFINLFVEKQPNLTPKKFRAVIDINPTNICRALHIK
ncbi:hypothetical protein SAMN05660845_1580 [Flavobacterium swingsii]|uniref:Uncharacterized protein n=1 Tax=Flavobacterium swingsii TaxID=498292 RepID=A0A1I0YBD9_9FLAO|nr:hypothetical protein [Flavobacterium swingsii]SFB09718.1 hypothetical protein SAMN05660845_1580 [Flavobacterium swingsii]